VTRRWAFATVGLAAGFTGLAVLGTILTGIPLLILEGVLVLVPVTAAAIVIRRAPRPVARRVWRVVRAGIVVGFVATIIYDVTRTVASTFDPSPYNPFEAIRFFGLGMVPADAPVALIMAAGLAIHLLNGCSFGVIYATVAGRHVRTWQVALVSGIAWGLTLEFIQSILYPGWLQITTVLNEFLLISGLGHFAYGASLGLGVRWILARSQGTEDRGD
jgi:hypothetical protein